MPKSGGMSKKCPHKMGKDCPKCKKMKRTGRYVQR